MQPLTVGDIELFWLKGGTFQLDGGTMFGPVPKLLWQKRYEADEDNMVTLCNDPILVRTPDKNIVIDTGLGNKLTKKQLSIYRLNEPWDVPAQLAKLGLAREEIDFVILTHCDFDHAGGLVMYNESGDEELTWPNANHIIQKKEWYDVEHPCRRAQSTYFPVNFSELKRNGIITLVDGEQQICDGLKVRHSGGHTRGHQIVEIYDRGEWGVHLGDLFPTHAHINPLWVMAYDNFPLDVIDLKQDYFSHYSKKDSWFLFYHDLSMRGCKLGIDTQITEKWRGKFAQQD